MVLWCVWSMIWLPCGRNAPAPLAPLGGQSCEGWREEEGEGDEKSSPNEGSFYTLVFKELQTKWDSHILLVPITKNNMSQQKKRFDALVSKKENLSHTHAKSVEAVNFIRKAKRSESLRKGHWGFTLQLVFSMIATEVLFTDLLIMIRSCQILQNH